MIINDADQDVDRGVGVETRPAVDGIAGLHPGNIEGDHRMFFPWLTIEACLVRSSSTPIEKSTLTEVKRPCSRARLTLPRLEEAAFFSKYSLKCVHDRLASHFFGEGTDYRIDMYIDNVFVGIRNNPQSGKLVLVHHEEI